MQVELHLRPVAPHHLIKKRLVPKNEAQGAFHNFWGIFGLSVFRVFRQNNKKAETEWFQAFPVWWTVQDSNL